MKSKAIITIAVFTITLLPIAHSLRCYSCFNTYKNVECAADTPVNCGSSSDRCVTAKFAYKTNETKQGEVETFYRSCTNTASCKTGTAPCKDVKDAICEYKCCGEDLCNNSARSSIFLTELLVLAFVGLLLTA